MLSSRALTQDLVSVILPVRDAGDNLGLATQQLACLSYPRVELIVVDDGSASPVAPTELEPLADALEATKLVRLDESGGVAAARNAGIKAASGDWVWFVDVDDQWNPSIISCLHTTAVTAHSDIAVCAAEVMSRGLTGGQYMSRLSAPAVLTPTAALELYLAGTLSGHLWNKLFAMDLIRSVGTALFPPQQRAFRTRWGSYDCSADPRLSPFRQTLCITISRSRGQS